VGEKVGNNTSFPCHQLLSFLRRKMEERKIEGDLSYLGVGWREMAMRGWGAHRLRMIGFERSCDGACHSQQPNWVSSVSSIHDRVILIGCAAIAH
jgi:hypothetical protein